MKKIISLFIVTILVGLSNVSAETSTTTTDDNVTSSATPTLYTENESTTEETTNTGTTSEETTEVKTTSEETTEVKTTSEETINDDSKKTSRDRVKEVQDNFAGQFNGLKEKFKDRSENTEKNQEFLNKKNELFEQYKTKLTEANQEKKAKREEVKINLKEQRQEIKDELQMKREETKKKYDSTYAKKYGKMISNLTKEKVEILLSKIDALVIQVNTGEYTDEAKVKLIAMLEAFKDMANNRLDALNMEADFNIDTIFQDATSN